MMKLATKADIADCRALSTAVFGEPNFDLYPRTAQSANAFDIQIKDGLWYLWRDKDGIARGIAENTPPVTIVREEFTVCAFWTDPTLSDLERRRWGLQMIIDIEEERMAAGFVQCTFDIPPINAKVLAFADWVEDKPLWRRVSGTDPTTGAAHYINFGWDLKSSHDKAVAKLAAMGTPK